MEYEPDKGDNPIIVSIPTIENELKVAERMPIETIEFSLVETFELTVVYDADNTGVEIIELVFNWIFDWVKDAERIPIETIEFPLVNTFADANWYVADNIEVDTFDPLFNWIFDWVNEADNNSVLIRELILICGLDCK